MKKTILALAALLFLLSVPAAHATTYYLSPAPAGSDANDGSMFHPWRSPNHAVNCGDQILASASNSYSASSFGSGKWGPVSGSGHCLAFLICATFDSCKINASGSAGIAVSASHWAVMGWEVTNSGNDYPCFEAYAEGSSTGVTDVLFANDIANGCYGSGFTIVSNGSAPADYVVAIADIVYNAAQENSVCTSGFNFFTPTQADTATGTHLFISQSFSWANVDPNPCGGQAPTDGEGFILDSLDAYGYAQQVALENNISLFNGSAGFEAWASTQAPIFIQNNTSYGNSGAPDRNSSWCGEIVSLTSSNVVAEKNIAMTDAAIGCGSWPIYALFISGPVPANILDSNGIYSAYGYYEGGSAPAWGPNNVLANPNFAGPPASVPEAPNCASYSSVIACMAPIIADFVSSNSSMAGWGYQPVSNSSVNDPLFPKWLCQYSSQLSGLITMDCGTSPTAPAITSVSSVGFTEGTVGSFNVTATGTPTPSLSESGALPPGVSFTAATGALSGSPAMGTAGIYVITLSAQNGIGSTATQSFTLTVASGATAPAITSASSATFFTGLAGTLTVTATGMPRPILSESGTLPSGVSFIPATGALSGTPAAGTNGTYPITLTAQNGVGLTATESIILTVSQSQAAAITSTNNTTFVVGTAGSFPVTVTGTPAPILSESGTLPTGVTFTPATGALAGTPALGISGTYPITIIAQNGVTPAATQSFTLTVNQAAAITSANNTTFLVGTAGTFTVTATGTPAATLSEAGPLPAGVSFTVATGMLAGSPAPGTNGSYPITFTAQNSVGAPTVQSFTLTVGQLQSVCTPLYPPSGTYLNDLNFSTFNVDANLTHTLNAVQSPDCTTSAASYIETTGSGQHSANESYAGSVPNGTLITQTLYVSNASGSRYLDLAIFDQSFAHYGVIFGINPTTCATSQSVFTDSGTGHWTLPGTPLTLTAVTVNGVAWCQVQLSVIPQSYATGLNIYMNYDTSSTGGGGSYTGDGVSGMNFWSETIQAVTPPALTGSTSATFTVGAAGSVSVRATGTPAPILSESGALPSGVSFTAATGVLSGTPAAGTAGTYPITFTAQNGVGVNATQSFNLIVTLGQPVCTPITPPSGMYFTDLTLSNFNVSSGLTRTLNAVQSPDCTTSAASYIETTGSGQHAATESYTGPVQNGAAITGTIYVASVSGSRFIDLGIYDQSFVHYGGVLGINPTACTASQPAFSDSGANHWILPVTPLKLTQVTLGGVVWCQIQFSVIPQSSASGLNFFLNYDASSAGAGASFSGDGTSGMMFWGASI